ncbi:MAG: acireductone synthase [Gemmatimonadota bacterium]
MPLPEGIRGVLTDIEGTTTPISFVYEVLFPFAEAHLEAVCSRAQAGSPEARALARLREEYVEERPAPEVPAFGNGAPYARYLMTLDRKSPGLKALQGLIWKRGYERGELRGEVFPDVPEALRAWRRAGVRLRAFSSGSVLAQQLLFRSTECGDLTGYFDGFHDTTTGPKREPASYTSIAEAFPLDPCHILFLSDVVPELDAAAAAGLATGLLLRPGNTPADPGGHPTYSTFRQLI